MNDDELGASLAYLGEAPIDQYLWLQSAVHDAEMVRGSTFAKRFNAFYRVRGAVGKHQDMFYAYFSELRTTQSDAGLPSFGAALTAFAHRMKSATGDGTLRAEASFVSKLLATLDPERPVFDSVVLARLNLSPRTHRPDKLAYAVATYGDLKAAMEERLASERWPLMRAHFNERFKDRDVAKRVTDMKALDLILWGAG